MSRLQDSKPIRTTTEQDAFRDASTFAPTPKPVQLSPWQRVKAYASIARPDHWFKNVFMLLGVLLAFFLYPDSLSFAALGRIAWAVVATCLIASSNYVINEILDAPTDLSHYVKRFRPIPSGQVWLPLAYVEWIILGIVGLTMA